MTTLTALPGIAIEIRRVWAEAKAHQIAAWEGYFRVGHLLGQARSAFGPDDVGYGAWFSAQGFGFSTEWGRRLRLAATNEEQARGILASALASRPFGVDHVLTELGLLGNGGKSPAADLELATTVEEVEARFQSGRARMRELSILLDHYIATSDFGGVERVCREAERIESEWAAFVLRERAKVADLIRDTPGEWRAIWDAVLEMPTAQALGFCDAVLADCESRLGAVA